MRLNLTTALPLAFVLVSGCWRRTEMAAVWHEPGSAVLNFNRTVAVFATTDEAMRRSVEDELAMKFPNSVPSYRLVPRAADVDKEQILPQMRSAGFDGAIVMRVTNVSERLTYQPGTYWGSPYGFGGYWGSAWAYPYNPGYVSTTQIVTVETNIYNLKSDRLVFAARSETSDPSSVGKLIRSVMRHINEELKKSGMMAYRYGPPGDVATEVAGH